jgi:hypothetical protein
MVSDSTAAGCAKYGCGCLFLGPFVVGGPLLLAGLVLDGGFSFVETLVVPLFLVVPAGILGLVVGKVFPIPSSVRRWMGTGGKGLLGFAVLALITAVGLTLRPAGFSTTEQVPPEEGLVGPIEISEDNMRLGVEVRQEIDQASSQTFKRWSFVTVELLDENKQYLSSFGGEFWHEAGYDQERWQEDDETYQATLRVPSAGTYYLRLKTESDVQPSELSPAQIKMYEQARWGTPIPFQIAGFFAVFFGLTLFIVSRVKQGASPRSMLEEDAWVRFKDQKWVVRNQLHYDYGDWSAVEWIHHSTDPGAKEPRYLECEDGSNWYWSEPVALEALSCTDTDGFETDVSHYASAHDTLPDRISYEGRQFQLQDSGTTQREKASLTYHTYEAEGADPFITIEGAPHEEMEAVVGTSISASAFEVESSPGGGAAEKNL